MSREKEQLPELTAFEAALAALAPRVERFDREQLIFRAGRASALRGTTRPRRRWAGWGWPAAFAAMTAVAASLLVMLCARPAPNAAVRLEQPEAAAPGMAEGKVAAEPSPASAVAVQTPVDHSLGAVAAWLSQWSAPEPSAGRGPERTDPAYSSSYPQLRGRFLRDGEGPYPPEAVVPAGTTAVAQQPLPYHELLDRLLQNQTPSRSQRDALGGIDGPLF
ncbi:MAG: hypothetical protein ABSG86_07440 [Thermoguttaceae bacterium]|jgi:hypothetical protein